MEQSAEIIQNSDTIKAAQQILDSLSEHIAVLDMAGNVITTNEAWDKFAAAGDAAPLERIGRGDNYIEACEALAAADKRLARVSRRTKAVLDGVKTRFTTEYPSGSTNGKRWIRLSVTLLKTDGEASGAVVTHTDITRRKLAEMETRRLAVTDPMTGILNRKAGMQFLQNQVKKCRKQKNPLTVCYLDLDNLKYVNDNFGHKEGDRIIMTSVRTIKKALRESDAMCRMGGDEILVILPDTSLSETSSVIARIRSLLDGKEIHGINKPYRIEFSYGLAGWSPDNKHTAEELVDIADGNMYSMKAAKKSNAETYERRGNDNS